MERDVILKKLEELLNEFDYEYKTFNNPPNYMDSREYIRYDARAGAWEEAHSKLADLILSIKKEDDG